MGKCGPDGLRSLPACLSLPKLNKYRATLMNFLQRSRRRMVKREDLWTERVNYATVATDEYKGGEKKGLQILLSTSQAGTGRKARQGQEEIPRNHVQAF